MYIYTHRYLYTHIRRPQPASWGSASEEKCGCMNCTGLEAFDGKQSASLRFAVALPPWSWKLAESVSSTGFGCGGAPLLRLRPWLQKPAPLGLAVAERCFLRLRPRL